MKTKIILIAIAMLFVAGLQIMAQEYCTHADGTPGGEVKYIQYTDPSSGCTYNVKLCVTCSVVSGIFKVDIVEYGWDPTTGCSAPSELAKKEIRKLVYSEAGFRMYCGCPIPPCDQGVITIYGSMYACHIVEIISQYEWRTVPCPTSSAYCYFYFTMCWDGTKYVKSDIIYLPTNYENILCPEVVDESNPPMDGSCYRSWTPCDDIE